MPISSKITHQYEQNPLSCGQAVIAMLSDSSQDDIFALLNNNRETTLKEMKYALKYYGFEVDWNKKQAFCKEDLPKIALLSLETPKCWHWSLYFKGTFYDPEHGISDDFPKSNRKYYFEIKR